MSIFDKWAENVNEEELKQSKQEMEENSNDSGNYEEVPHGDYEVKIDKMEAKTSSKGNPMISIWFKILEGKFKNSMIFYNGVYHEDWMRHRVVDFLASIIDDDSNKHIMNLILKDKSIKDVNDFIMDINEEVDGKFEYLLEYGSKKGYNTYKIKEVYEVE